MKILHVYKTYATDSTGGVEQVIRQICLATTPQGVENRVFCLSRDKELKPLQLEEAEVFRCPVNFEIASTPFSWQAFAAFKKLAAWADVIHYQFPWPFADLLCCAAQSKKPYLVSYQSDIVRQNIALFFYRPLQHYFLKSATKIIATSPPYAKTSPVLRNFEDKVSVIPIGLDKATYPEVTAAQLQYWEQRVGRGFFLFVGVMRYYKGLHILLEAAQGTTLPIVIAGAGPLESELKQQAERLKLNNVIFLGKVSDEDKVALLLLSLGVVFPSHLRSEAFGVSLLEGAMYGKPMISTEIGTGTSYINLHQETGLVVPPANAIALREAMQFLADNTDVAMQMGKNAEERYWKYFTAKTMGMAYLETYQNLIAQKPA